MDVCAPKALVSGIFVRSADSATRTKSMTMVLNRNTKNLEGMHANSHALHSLFALENQVDGAREQSDKRVSIRSSQKDTPELEFHHLAHGLH